MVVSSGLSRLMTTDPDLVNPIVPKTLSVLLVFNWTCSSTPEPVSPTNFVESWSTTLIISLSFVIDPFVNLTVILEGLSAVIFAFPAVV